MEFNPTGTLKADPVTYQTAEPDIFTGGDNYTGPRFAIDAIAAGKEGCVSIHRFVHEGQSLTLGRNRRQFIELDKDNIKVETFDNANVRCRDIRLEMQSIPSVIYEAPLPRSRYRKKQTAA